LAIMEDEEVEPDPVQTIKSASITLGVIPDVQVEDWAQFFETGDIRFENFKYEALLQGLPKNGLRSLFWKIFLGYIPPNPQQWAEVLQPKRQTFTDHLNTLQDMPDIGDPLGAMVSEDTGVSWSDYYIDKELKETIELDLGRCHTDIPFFRSPATKSSMLNVLMVYSKKDSIDGYKQGMHEILANLIMVNAACAHACLKNFSSDHKLRLAMDTDYIEHDTYWMFVEIMKNMGQYFHRTDKNSEPPVVKKCKYIQHTLLRKLDPKLSEYLRHIQISPQLYGMRWYRLFFAQEFHIRDACHMWDSIFAEYQDAKSFELVDYIVCAMLRYVRSRIISKEQTTVYKTLMHFPPVEDCWVLVQAAINLRDQENQLVKAKPQTPRQVKMNRVAESRKKPTLVQKAFQKVIYAADDVARFAGGKPTRKIDEGYKKAYERVVAVHNALSKKCSDMVEDMSKIQLESEFSEQGAFEKIIAETKMLRDSLSGNLDLQTIDQWLQKSGISLSYPENADAPEHPLAM